MSNEEIYLKAIEAKMNGFANAVDELDDRDPELLHQLLALAEEAVKFEASERQGAEIASRFSILSSQLKSLVTDCKKEVEAVHGGKEEQEDDVLDVADDETEIFIYLFNTNGMKLITWQPLLAHRALIDHGVNRPIYARKRCIEELIRSKSMSTQHAFVRAVIKKQDILMSEADSILKDNIGNPIIRIKYGVLKASSLREFCHEGHVYEADSSGNFSLRKPSGRG